ncbi:MAG TPA: N-6 DNA methylase [Bryobacteraceae bacterium]|nr:N-6 DNA methylase [Bryobacteraceae bacterium]
MGEPSHFSDSRIASQLEIAARLPGEPGRDALGEVYQSLVPRAQRHATGEYYTPYWLASLLLDEAGYEGDTSARLLDPACGSGVFLLVAIERAWRRGAALGQSPEETARGVLSGIRGFDVNPLAVQAARANYRQALTAAGWEARDDEIPVFRRDALLEPADGGTFDLIAGNPPWVRWDHLPAEYREATLPLWKSYGLFSLKGFEARLGGGKKDLSMLFTLAAADRYLKPGGVLAFLITQEAFKTKGAGEGFRRFRLPDGTPLGVIRAHDFTGVRPFGGAANKTAAVLLRKGEETVYPVPYVVWTRHNKELERTELEARPMGSLYGPWQTLPAGEMGTDSHFATAAKWWSVPISPPNYRAMLGANANPYGVFWLEILAGAQGGTVRVRNMAERGKRPIAPVEAEVEAELVYPAVRGADIARWSAGPGVHVLLVQDPAARRGYAEATMQERWPLTLRYLRGFREELLRRALYRKYHEEAGNPFYSQFNIAVETFSPFKVVWKRMSNDLVAAVISDWDGPLGRRRMIPLETTSFIPVENAAEAHYLCAVLNSGPVREFVKSFSSAGRGFGTPSVIRHLRLPRFDAGNPVHRELAEISEQHHRPGADEGAGQKRLEKLMIEKL